MNLSILIRNSREGSEKTNLLFNGKYHLTALKDLDSAD